MSTYHTPSWWVSFFLPISSTTDKMKGNSSFANAITKLRGRTGRLDPALGAHSSKADASYVGLYALGDPEDNYSRGAVRFMNVMSDPPRQGKAKGGYHLISPRNGR